ncbi:FAD-dependent oxidoreductase [Mobilicoccus caccae]|uniref:FAD-dependent oxidoreductase n=1 Tax=Mobilicoccus caccae TaxID=1859295 RepID=A0ABQ6IXU9_9MICO|nr:FAD-dependent oxidoreductase [Mobilicoccus caccae]GMA42148.1 FAD-dependent oxidoreductase [Mobilicoccus caccae]
MLSLWHDGRTPISSDTLDQDTYDVVVVGAGLTGLVTGLLLARAGKDVAILEAEQVGALATGNTTAKLSLLQGTKLSTLRKKQSEKVLRSYVEGNREGQAWLRRFCAENDVAVEARDAVTYAPKRGQAEKQARAEFDAAREMGLPVRWESDLPLPVPHVGGVVLPDQAQFDPMDVLAALATQFRSAGGTLVTGARVVVAGKVGKPSLRLEDGRRVRAQDVILATGAPILDRGLYFAKLEPMRSYAIAFDHPDAPEVMALSSGSSTRSLRDAPGGANGRRLLVGGEGHPVGRTSSERGHLDTLREWTQRYYPGAVETHVWAAQDYRSHDGIPYVGSLPLGGGNFHVATGYDKWGMTNAVMAARVISSSILGDEPEWAKPMGRRISGPKAVAGLAGINAKVGVAATLGVVGAAVSRDDERIPGEGEGYVTRDGVAPIARSTVDGTTCEISALCSHLGGVVKWNDAERSWDCPLHGSRFTHDGRVIEGPATKPLGRRD